jgi:hypothetical protein
MEVNEFVYGFLWLAFLFESMILLGVIINSKQKSGELNWYYKIDFYLSILFISGMGFVIIGFALILLTNYTDSLYGIGIGLLAIGFTLLIFNIQENGNKKIIKKIDDLKNYKPEK